MSVGEEENRETKGTAIQFRTFGIRLLICQAPRYELSKGWREKDLKTTLEQEVKNVNETVEPDTMTSGVPAFSGQVKLATKLNCEPAFNGWVELDAR